MGSESIAFDPEHKNKAYLIATLIGSTLLLSVNLLLPLSWDNEIFQSMAMDLFRFHRLPYLGSWAHDLPGTVYVHWFSIVIFGDSALGFRTFDLLLHLAMSWMFYGILRRWLTPRTACLAVLLSNLRYISYGYWLAGQRDEFAMFFLLLGVLLLFKIADSETSPFYRELLAFCAGVSLAMMPTMRITYGLFVIVGVVFLWMPRQSLRSTVLPYLAGATAVLLALIVPYLLVPGGLEQAYLACIAFNAQIYGEIRTPFDFLFRQLAIQKLYFLAGLLGMVVTVIPILRQNPRIRSAIEGTQRLRFDERVLIIGISIASIISIAVMGKFMPYHFNPLMLVVIPFAALAIDGIVRAMPYPILKAAVILFLLGYAILRIFPQQLIGPYLVNIRTGVPHPIKAAQDLMVPEIDFRKSVEENVASYIDRTASPGEPFEAATLTAGIRLRTPRMSATRFTTFWPLSLPSPKGEHPAFQQLWRKEYIDSLLSVRPYYLVIGNGPMEVLKWVKETPLQCIHEIPGFDSLVFPRYALDTVIGGYWIYRRK